MTSEEQLKGYLGLAMRSGQAVLGGGMVLEHIRSGRSGVVLIDEDASDNTRKKLLDACAFRHVRCITVPGGVISLACGRADRMAVSVPGGGLAAKIILAAEQTEKIQS